MPHCNHGDDYFKYLLGVSSVHGSGNVVMCKIGWWKLVQNVNHDAMQTFNKMHASGVGD